MGAPPRAIDAGLFSTIFLRIKHYFQCTDF